MHVNMSRFWNLCAIYMLMFGFSTKRHEVACASLFNVDQECADSGCSYTWACSQLSADPRGIAGTYSQTLPSRSAIYLFKAMTAKFRGYINQVTWFSACAGTIRLGIWAPISGTTTAGTTTFQLRQKIEVITRGIPGGSRQTWMYDESQKNIETVTMFPGDIVGVHFASIDQPASLNCLQTQIPLLTNASAVETLYLYTAVYGDQYRDPLGAYPLNKEQPFLPTKIAIANGKQTTTVPFPMQTSPIYASLRVDMMCFCSSNCQEGLCNNGTGECSLGCIPGYSGKQCGSPCQVGFYGANCAQRCSFYCLDGECNTKTGACFDCMDLHYGLSVECSYDCGNCANNTYCNSTTGTCLNGCAPGYLAPYCVSCAPGFYGPNCDRPCGMCLNNVTCEPFGGTCLTGCSNGYQPPNCASPCKSGFFGYQCVLKCGNCRSNQICDPSTGNCPDGKCEMGWNTPQCRVPGTNTGIEGDALFCPQPQKVQLSVNAGNIFAASGKFISLILFLTN